MIQRLSTTNQAASRSIARSEVRQARSTSAKTQSSFADLFNRGTTTSDPQKSAAAATTSTPVAAEPPKTPDPRSVPTAESVFGAKPWIANPQGQGLGQTWSYNPTYFATKQ